MIGLGYLFCNGRCMFDYFCSIIFYYLFSCCMLVFEVGYLIGYCMGKKKKKKKFLDLEFVVGCCKKSNGDWMVGFGLRVFWGCRVWFEWVEMDVNYWCWLSVW